jgi:hypothetical protein
LAFLITFSVLLGVGLFWMGLFAWLTDADSAALNAIADWLSPERASGWVFYLLVSLACFLPLARRYIRKARDRQGESHDAD